MAEFENTPQDPHDDIVSFIRDKYYKGRSISEIRPYVMKDANSFNNALNEAYEAGYRQKYSTVDDFKTKYYSLKGDPFKKKEEPSSPVAAQPTTPLSQTKESKWMSPQFINRQFEAGYDVEKKAKVSTNEETASRFTRWNQGKAKGMLTPETEMDDYERNFIENQFGGTSPKVQEKVFEHLKNTAQSDPDAYSLLLSRTGENGMSDKEKANLVQRITSDELRKTKEDLEILDARVKTGDTNVKKEKVANLMARHQENYDIFKDAVKMFPEEYERLKRVKANNEAMTIKEGDGGGTKVYKQVFSTLGAIQNSALDGAISTLKWARGVSDELSGEQNIRGLTDKVVEGVADYLDSWKFGQPTKYEGADDLTGSQEFNKETFLPKLAGQLGNMAMLFYASKGNALKLSVAGAATSYGGYYDDAKQKGMDETFANRYGLYMSAIQGMLENVNPNFGLAEFKKFGLKEGVQFLKENPKASVGNFLKSMGKNALGENTQEIIQSVADVAANNIANHEAGKDLFDTEITPEELAETITLTTAVSLLAGGMAKKHFDSQHKEALELIKSAKPEVLAQNLNDLIRKGVLNSKDAQKINDLAGKKFDEVQEAKMFGQDGEPASDEPTNPEPKADDAPPPTPKDSKGVESDTVKPLEIEAVKQEEKPQQSPVVEIEQKQSEPISPKKDVASEEKIQSDKSSNKNLDPKDTKKVQEINEEDLISEDKSVTLEENNKDGKNTSRDGTDEIYRISGKPSEIPNGKGVVGNTTANVYDESKGENKKPEENPSGSEVVAEETTTLNDKDAIEVKNRVNKTPMFAAKSEKYFEYVPLSEIEGYIEQDREIDPKNNLNELTEDIKDNGIKKPIQLKVDRNGKALIVEGNTRIAAAKRLGIKNIPVEIIEGEFGNINKNLAKDLPDIGYSEKQKRSKELSLDKINGAYSKGFSKIESIDIENSTVELSDKEQRAANGILNETKDAALLDILPEESKAKVREYVSAEMKKSAPAQTVPEPTQQKPKKEKKQANVTTKGVFGNTKAINNFEPLNTEERILRDLALGMKLNEKEFNHLQGADKQGWSQNQTLDSNNENSLDFNYSELENATEARSVFENITLRIKDRNDAVREIKRIQEKRGNIENGIDERAIEHQEYLAKHAAQRQEKGRELDDEAYQEFSDYAYKIDEAEAQAKADEDTAKRHNELYDKINNDPQYKNEDGTFNFVKLKDNIENGFEPDLLELGIFESQNKIAPQDESRQQATERIAANIKSKESIRNTEGGERGESVEQGSEEEGSGIAEGTLRSAKAEIEILNKGWDKIKNTDYGDKGARRYFDAMNKYLPSSKNDIIEYRYGGAVVKEGNDYKFYPIMGTNSKEWYIGKAWNFDEFNKKDINEISNNKETITADTKRVAEAGGGGEESSRVVQVGITPDQQKTIKEAELLDKRIKGERNADKKRILEKKKAELQKRLPANFSNEKTEIEDTDLQDSLTNSEAIKDSALTEIELALQQAKNDFKKSSGNFYSGIPIDPNKLDAAARVIYLTAKKFVYKYGNFPTLSQVAEDLKESITEGFKSAYNRARNLWLNQNNVFSNELSWVNQARELFQDRTIAVKQLYKDIQRAGVPTLTDNFAEAQELTQSKIADKQRRADEWYRGKEGKEFGATKSRENSWIGRLKKAGITYESQRDFMYANQALDFNERAREIFDKRREVSIAELDDQIAKLEEEYIGNPTTKLKEKINALNAEKQALLAEPYPTQPSGMTDQEAQDIINEVQKSGKYDEMMKFADEFRENTVIARINEMQNSGLINAEVADHMRNGTREGFKSVLKNYIPLKVQTQELGDRLHAGQGKLGSQIFGIQVTDKYGKAQRFDPLAMAMTELQATYKAAETNRALNQLYNSVLESPFGDNIRIVNQRGYTQIGTDGNPTDSDLSDIKDPVSHQLIRDHSIPVKVDGKTKHIFISPIKDEKGMWKKHPVIRALKSQPQHTGSLIRTVVDGYRAVVNVLRLLRTSYNIGFAIDNPMRDIQEAMSNITDVEKTAVETAKLQASVAKNWGKALKFFISPKSMEDAEMSKMMDEMRQNGVGMSWANFEGVDKQVADYQAIADRFMSKGTGRNYKEMAQVGLNLLGIVSESTENVTRLAVYKSLRDNGYSEQRSAYIAKNVTLNFEKKGTKGSAINLLYMFANAGIQSSARMAKAAKSKNFWKFGAGVITAAALNRALLLSKMNDDDEDNYIYNDIENKGRILIYNPFDPKNPIRLPKAYSAMRVFLNLGESAADVYYGKRTTMDSALNNVGDALMNVVDPLGGSGSSWTNYVPTEFLKNFIQVNIANEDWGGKKILKGQGYADKNQLPDYMRTNPNTPVIFDQAALALNEKTGLEIQPTTLEYFYKNYLGQAIKAIKDYPDIAKAAYDVTTGKDVNTAEVPILKRFYYDIEDKKYQRLFNTFGIIDDKEYATKEQIRYVESTLSQLKGDKQISDYTIKKIREALAEMKNPEIGKKRQEKNDKEFKDKIKDKQEKSNK